MMGLTTPSAEDKSVMLPAKKPTRFMSSSRHMLKRLNVRCDGGHQHQHLSGGRASAAAFYPMKVVTEIVRGMRDTWDAEHVDESEVVAQCNYGGETGTQNTIVVQSEFNDPLERTTTELLCALAQEEIEKANRKAESWIPKRGHPSDGFKVTFDDQSFKPQYVDEYTREVIPMHLVIEELTYWNSDPPKKRHAQKKTPR